MQNKTVVLITLYTLHIEKKIQIVLYHNVIIISNTHFFTANF